MERYYENWHRRGRKSKSKGKEKRMKKRILALLLVVVSDIVIGMIVVESMLWKIKKVPISLGVLQ